MHASTKRTSSFWTGVSLVCLGLSIGGVCGNAPLSWAQTASPVTNESAGTGGAVEDIQTPERVEVDPTAQDEEIASRLQRILEATQWFQNPAVQVDNGVVFLQGATHDVEQKKWASTVAQRTQAVVAVVNRIRLVESPIWDLSPAWTELRSLWRQTIQALPLSLLAVVLFVLTCLTTLGTVRFAHRFLTPRMPNRLLLGVAEKAAAVPVFLLGLYIVLRVSGLTQLALTILGGTGVLGLVIGIAFRDIAENFLASLLMSTRNPFRSGDLIEVAGHLGYVQKVTSRGTVLMTFEGNYVQIPNAMIYKNTLLNYSANPNIRLDFVIGVGYDSSLVEAQEVAIDVLRAHPLILAAPEPMVLVEELGAATISLRIQFWVDGQKHSGVRVKSSVMRQMVRAFEEAGISLPDEAREIIFPQGVPIQTLEANGQRAAKTIRPAVPPVTHQQRGREVVSTAAEGDLRSEAVDLQTQIKHAEMPEQGRDLLTRES